MSVAAVARVADRVRTVGALGLGNVARVAAYRLLLRSGGHPVQRLRPRPLPPGPHFRPAAAQRAIPAPAAWGDAASYFGWHRVPLSAAPPDWHRSPFNGTAAAGAGEDWWRLPDFDPATGDIKAIWEASRLDWAVSLAQQAAAGRAGALDRLNAWLDDWIARNPCYRGHNWKCAQEASIRVLHLALAARVLGALTSPAPALVELGAAHLRRIAPTVSYAIGQANNHGTSEAAALFVGGSWLAALGTPGAAAWAARGRELLERCARRLVQPDGSFSQYSVNYHRLMLETLCLAEVFRRHLGAPELSQAFRERAAAATRWLRALVDPETGDAPNYGANDGAHLLPLTDAGYRDFRPAVAVASALFEGERAFEGAGPWDAQLAWLEIPSAEHALAPAGSRVFADGGQAVLRSGEARVLFVFPHYRFRPGHCDALHLDLSVRGVTALGDAGSYSYAADPAEQAAFSGVAGHNTVQFDGREQMRSLSRFLRGPWLADAVVTPLEATPGAVRIAASYRDAAGGAHARSVELRPDALLVRDDVRGFASRAVLRWRLRPGDWRLAGTAVTDGVHRLEVTADVPFARVELVGGAESRYYLCKEPVPVLEVEVSRPGSLSTTYRWRP